MAGAVKTAERTYAIGVGPALEVTDLPAPPPMDWRSVLRVIGPSAIVLGVAIGSGEWLIGPSVTAQYGPGLLWIATVSIILQTVLNLEMVRYTMCTGEPIFVGMARLRPGSRFWGTLLVIISFLERAWPGWAFTAATAVAVLSLGRLAGPEDSVLIIVVGAALMLLCVVLVSVGGVIERTLEIVQWIMIGLILIFLIAINLIVSPASAWGETLAGFFRFGFWPAGASITLLAALAGYAGAGGLNNTTISNYYRDKGFGMGQVVGAIPTAIGGKKITVSPAGKIFMPDEENLKRWRLWRKLSLIDIIGVFTVGAFIGMYLPNVLVTAVIPRGSQLSQWSIAAYQADALRNAVGAIGWFVPILAGFWILFSTQLGSVDMFTRTVTDILWFTSPRIRTWSGGQIRRVYYTVLGVFVAWALAAFVMVYGIKAQPIFLILLAANMSNVVLALTGSIALYLNRRYLPQGVRPGWGTVTLLVIGILFWATFATMSALTNFFGVRF
ncbi:MAG TPA: Nramp family divalent metal transporter [Limnochordales bacterium]